MQFDTLSLFLLSILMIVLALSFLIVAIKKGQFNNISRDAMIPFDEEEQAGEPTDQLFE